MVPTKKDGLKNNRNKPQKTYPGKNCFEDKERVKKTPKADDIKLREKKNGTIPLGFDKRKSSSNGGNKRLAIQKTRGGVKREGRLVVLGKKLQDGKGGLTKMPWRENEGQRWANRLLGC